MKKIIYLTLTILLIITSFPFKVEASCKIQGFRTYYGDNEGVSGPVEVFSTKISTDSSLFSASNPYFLIVPEGNYIVTASVPSGYEVGYTICYNNIGCHNQDPVISSVVPVSCSSGIYSYIDLWWHYKKLGDLDNNKTVNLQDLLQLLGAYFL